MQSMQLILWRNPSSMGIPLNVASLVGKETFISCTGGHIYIIMQLRAERVMMNESLMNQDR